ADVGEFDADRPAVGGAELFDQVTQGAVGRPLEAGGTDGKVEILRGDVKLGKIEQRMGGAIVAERVKLGDEVSEFAVGMDKVVDPKRQRARALALAAAGRNEPASPGSLEAGEIGLPE